VRTDAAAGRPCREESFVADDMERSDGELTEETAALASLHWTLGTMLVLGEFLAVGGLRCLPR
jgi:hypothetical protein